MDHALLEAAVGDLGVMDFNSALSLVVAVMQNRPLVKRVVLHYYIISLDMDQAVHVVE